MDKIIFYPLGKGWEKVFVFSLAEIFYFYTASQNFIPRKYGKLLQDAISQQTKTDIDWLPQFRDSQERMRIDCRNSAADKPAMKNIHLKLKKRFLVWKSLPASIGCLFFSPFLIIIFKS